MKTNFVITKAMSEEELKAYIYIVNYNNYIASSAAVIHAVLYFLTINTRRFV
jgi:hypothetical protein